MSIFSQRLRQLRELKGWTQNELADRLHISRSTVGNYEQGTREPKFEDLEAIADIFNCTISFLVEKNRLGPDEWYDISSIPMLKGMELTEEERFNKELIRLYRNATPDAQTSVMTLLKNSQKREASNSLREA